MHRLTTHIFMQNFPHAMRLHAFVMSALDVTKAGDLPPNSNNTISNMST
jgi:hypothetical protein